MLLDDDDLAILTSAEDDASNTYSSATLADDDSSDADSQAQGRSSSAQSQQPAPGRSERGAMSYSEATDGTVAEHEAMQSTVMNRVAGGQKYWVDRNKEVNETNVVTASNPKQYLGVGGPLYTQYYNGDANGPGAQNAMQAERNIARTGTPTTDATSFVVHRDGSPPTDEEVFAMGHVVPANPPKVGRVYL